MSKPFISAIAALLLLDVATVAAAPVEEPAELRVPVVRVNSTNQDYDFFRPWSKNAPDVRKAVGAVLADNRVLVTAAVIANHTYVELEKPESAERSPATVEAVDYEANLALLKPVKENFLSDFKSLELSDPCVPGDNLEVWQLESNGTLVASDALLTTVEVVPYPSATTALLAYRLSGALENRDASYTMPLAKDERLAGMVMRYESSSQSMLAVPVQVIEHFLKEARDENYEGLPWAGITFSNTRDPQLRRFLGIEPGNGGVLITEVRPGSAAERAEVKQGDVLLSIKGYPIDADGNYRDETYGRLLLVNLINLRSYAGDEVPIVISRGGEKQELTLKLDDRKPGEYISPPFVVDEPPRFIVAGGLVFQELSRQYLREWGNNWPVSAPRRLVFFDRYQHTLFPDNHRKIVFLSQVLGVPGTLGYEDLSHIIVSRVNDQEIQNLQDLQEALDNPQDGFHKIEFEQDPRILYLDVEQMKQDEKILREQYGLQELQRL